MFLPRDASSLPCNQRLPGRKMKGLSGARNERRPHYGETRFRDERKKKILIVLNAVAAAYSAIKGSAIKRSEATNGEEVFLREMRCYCPAVLAGECLNVHLHAGQLINARAI